MGKHKIRKYSKLMSLCVVGESKPFYTSSIEKINQDIKSYICFFSSGPTVHVNTLNGYLFTCNILELYDKISTHITNESYYIISIIINNVVLQSPYLITTVHMLAPYIQTTNDEIQITLIKEFKSTILSNRSENSKYTFNFRVSTLEQFYYNLDLWKDQKLMNILNMNYILSSCTKLNYINNSKYYLKKSKYRIYTIICRYHNEVNHEDYLNFLVYYH